VDADHIAAIDKVTRNMIAERKGPTTVGLSYSLGHSDYRLIGAGVAIAPVTAITPARGSALQKTVGGLMEPQFPFFLFAIAALKKKKPDCFCNRHTGFARVVRRAYVKRTSRT